MADNVPITAGTGTDVATDDVAGVQYQRIKLSTAANGSADIIGDTAFGSTRALWVDPRVQTARVVVTPTISNGAIYATGDCLGGLQTITPASRLAGGTGTVIANTLLDKTQAQRAAIDLVFFGASVTSAGDNNPAAFSDADMAACIGIVQVGGYNTAWPGTPLNSFATRLDVNLPYAADGSLAIYCQAVVRGTPTYTSTADLVFTYVLLLD